MKPHEDIPRYLRHMDVNVMCYRTDRRGWWSEIFPLKSFEYLAAGRPIVSAPVKTMTAFAGDMAIASTPEEWIEAIGHALSAGGVGTVRSRRQRARENTWDHRIDRLHGWMLEALARRSG
jgi:glycosyltransferase involved in cell wall biosynthesis